ncbi:MAG TPA: cellulase family glycosylhydrolase [Polyangia bacterium]
MARRLTLLLLCAAALGACVDGPAPRHDPLPLTRLTTDRTYLRDEHGRYVFFHGVNVSGSTKAPDVDATGFADYLTRPFPLADADAQLAKIRQLGFTSLRLLVMWEGIEPYGKGEYDAEYLDSIREIVKRAGDHGLHVLLDMHQDMFSRHLRVKYNRHPAADPGTLEYSLLALVKPYDDEVKGDGAPRWAVQACLQEKDMTSPHWGTPRLVSGLNADEINNLVKLYQKLTGQTQGGSPPDWTIRFVAGLPGEFPVNETTDLLPMTHWGIAHALSLDLARCYACLFAGDVVFPGLTRNGQSVKDYLQEAYADAWAQVALKVRDLPNVIGYDLINEPSGNYLVLSAVAGLMKAGVPDGAKDALVNLFGVETGTELYEALVALRVLPPDGTPATLRLFGLDKLDPLAALGLNTGFSDNHLRPFYERVGKAIQDVDPKAVFFIEDGLSAGSFLGGSFGGLGGQWETPMTRPQGLDQVVFAPHWYADIYPFLGFDQAPRSFSVEEVRYRDYDANLATAAKEAAYSLGNAPVVFGEFGTYFNFNGIEDAVAQKYAVSGAFLDNYYEAFERGFQSNMLWCWSKENDPEMGDFWNHEDFSVIDPAEKPRAQAVWARPHARFLAGKPHTTHFYSDQHYFDPDKGVPDARREFEVRYGSKETTAPSEIVVPQSQYPDGFYVWLSDGYAYWDAATQTLYHYPSRDEPGFEHFVRIRPPLPGEENVGWSYFFKDGLAVGGR